MRTRLRGSVVSYGVLQGVVFATAFWLQPLYSVRPSSAVGVFGTLVFLATCFGGWMAYGLWRRMPGELRDLSPANRFVVVRAVTTGGPIPDPALARAVIAEAGARREALGSVRPGLERLAMVVAALFSGLLAALCYADGELLGVLGAVYFSAQTVLLVVPAVRFRDTAGAEREARLHIDEAERLARQRG